MNRWEILEVALSEAMAEAGEPTRASILAEEVVRLREVVAEWTILIRNLQNESERDCKELEAFTGKVLAWCIQMPPGCEHDWLIFPRLEEAHEYIDDNEELLSGEDGERKYIIQPLYANTLKPEVVRLRAEVKRLSLVSGAK